MSVQEALAYLEISRASLYRLYLQPGKLTPLRNPALPHGRLRFRAADIHALRPDKAPHLDAAPPRLLAEDPAPYDPHS
jgi:predicted site-specific integrase-resolvase